MPVTIESSRFRRDHTLLDELLGDAEIGPRLKERSGVGRRHNMRMRLLANAVRVQSGLLPKVARSFERLRSRAELSDDLEAYVFEDSAINAFVTRGRTRLIIGLSSAAINNLDESELDFVVGHELGHALFQHIDFGGNHLLSTEAVDPRHGMRILAWSRAAEITADRVGLICCSSIDVAATAMFKTLSGLSAAELRIDAREFAQQWEHLVNEVLEDGGDDHWQLTHPFPPLRMKAMLLFWESGYFAASGASGWSSAAVDGEVERHLAMMDPLARERKDSVDPVLADFFLWGGIYLALANGEFDERERLKLANMTSAGRIDQLVRSGIPSPQDCLTRFSELITGRRNKLKALEIHRILQGLLHVAHADGGLDGSETAALKTLAESLGIAEHACDLLISKFHPQE